MNPTTFQFPAFYDYPPYFTLQPVKETQNQQSAQWGALILNYCKHEKIFQLDVDGGENSPLFVNQKIKRCLSPKGRQLFLQALVEKGNAEWLNKNKTKCLILWKKVSQWADTLFSFIENYGLQGSVMTVEEISSGDETKGTELEGIDREVLMRAISVLEDRGKARLFKGEGGDAEGVKFFD